MNPVFLWWSRQLTNLHMTYWCFAHWHSSNLRNTQTCGKSVHEKNWSDLKSRFVRRRVKRETVVPSKIHDPLCTLTDSMTHFLNFNTHNISMWIFKQYLCCILWIQYLLHATSSKRNIYLYCQNFYSCRTARISQKKPTANCAANTQSKYYTEFCTKL